MRLRNVTPIMLILISLATASAHDLFLKLDTYFLTPNSQVTVRVLNGTFKASDALVARDRINDVTVLGPEFRKTGTESLMWRDEGQTTLMQFETSAPGTYVAAISTKPRENSLKAAQFNEYLQHEGIPDVLAARRKQGELAKDVRYRYSKHVRTLFQVGDKLTDEYKTPLNYPVEMIPQQNPYALKLGQTLPVLFTLNGKPLRNQYVIAGWEDRNGKLHQVNTRSDSNGVARIKLTSSGKWFVKFIHMEPINEAGLNYESRWATLTFEMR
jgi:hypothetical protein